MSLNIKIVSAGEVFARALDIAREHSDRILQLADLNASPLLPGESPDNRCHAIAKLAKVLAEAFLTVDNLVRATIEARMEDSDVTAGDIDCTTPDNPDAN